MELLSKLLTIIPLSTMMQTATVQFQLLDTLLSSGGQIFETTAIAFGLFILTKNQ